MPVGDIRKLTPDSTVFGENIARTLRILAKLLFDWSSAEQCRRQLRLGGGAAQGATTRAVQVAFAGVTGGSLYLRAIYFDKLATAFARVWNRLHKEGKVRYSAGLITQRGFHGPGQTMTIDRPKEEERALGKDAADYRRNRFAFVTEVVEKLKPAIGNARLLFRLQGKSWDWRCKVYPELDPSQWDAWTANGIPGNGHRAFLVPGELEFVVAISGAIADLDKDEIRAIGTHSCALETCRDIEFNMVAWERNSASLLGCIRNRDEAASTHAYKLVTTAREVLNKSFVNRQAYERARRKIVQSLSISIYARDAFEGVQDQANSIWEDTRVCAYHAYSSILLAFSTYARRGVAELCLSRPLQERELRESDQAIITLTGELPRDMQPSPYGSISTLGGSAWAQVVERLSQEVIRRMPGSLDREDLGVP